MCARPAVRRLSRLYATEIEKILPGAELLSETDVQRTCNLLNIAVPDRATLDAQAAGRIRATRSGRKFNTWGSDIAEEKSNSNADEDIIEISEGSGRKRARRS